MSEVTNDNGNVIKHGPLKVGYLVTGLVFIGLAGSWALDANGAIDGMTVSWLLPGILVGAGVIGLVAMLASGVRRGRPRADTDSHTSSYTSSYETGDTAGFEDPSDTPTIPEENQR